MYNVQIQLGEFPFQGPAECEQPKSVSDSNALRLREAHSGMLLRQDYLLDECI